MAEVMRDLLSEMDADLVSVVAYDTNVFIHPQHPSLLDAWLSLTDADRQDVSRAYPRLFTAIWMTCKASVPRSKACPAVSERGSSCRLDGDNGHEWHLSDPGFDGRVSSEVWRT